MSACSTCGGALVCVSCEDRGPSVGDVLDAYVATLDEKGRGEERSHLQPLLDHLGPFGASALTKRQADSYAPARRADTNQNGRPPTDSTVAKEYSLLLRALSWASGSGLIPHDKLGRYQKPVKARYLSGTYSDEEYRRYLAAAARHPNHGRLMPAIVRLHTDCLLTRGQVLSITWDGVDEHRALVADEGDPNVRRILLDVWLDLERIRPDIKNPTAKIWPYDGRHLKRVLEEIAADAHLQFVDGRRAGSTLLTKTGQRRLLDLGLAERVAANLAGLSVARVCQISKSRATDAEAEAAFERHELLRGGGSR